MGSGSTPGSMLRPSRLCSKRKKSIGTDATFPFFVKPGSCLKWGCCSTKTIKLKELYTCESPSYESFGHLWLSPTQREGIDLSHILHTKREDRTMKFHRDGGGTSCLKGNQLYRRKWAVMGQSVWRYSSCSITSFWEVMCHRRSCTKLTFREPAFKSWRC